MKVVSIQLMSFGCSLARAVEGLCDSIQNVEQNENSVGGTHGEGDASERFETIVGESQANEPV